MKTLFFLSLFPFSLIFASLISHIQRVGLISFPLPFLPSHTLSPLQPHIHLTHSLKRPHALISTSKNPIFREHHPCTFSFYPFFLPFLPFSLLFRYNTYPISFYAVIQYFLTIFPVPLFFHSTIFS